MRQLYPAPIAAVEAVDAYGRLGRVSLDRPAVRSNMISSVDGAASLDGRTAGLGGPSDRALLMTLRSLADVVLVGAGTARAEHYGPVRLPAELRRWRLDHGLPAIPPIAVLTRSGRLDWTSRLFTDSEVAPIVVTTESGAADAAGHASRPTDIVVAGESDVAVGAAIVALGERGFDNVLAEGGPAVLGQLAAADLIDELCLTIAPVLVASRASRIIDLPAETVPPTQSAQPALPSLPMRLLHVLEADDGYLFLRYVRPLT